MLLYSSILLPVHAQETDDPIQDAVAIFNQAQELHEKGDISGAIALYTKALKVFPDFPEAEYQCGPSSCVLIGHCR
jgi:tetratricopeptide (TPR) repeat protein